MRDSLDNKASKIIKKFTAIYEEASQNDIPIEILISSTLASLCCLLKAILEVEGENQYASICKCVLETVRMNMDAMKNKTIH